MGDFSFIIYIILAIICFIIGFCRGRKKANIEVIKENKAIRQLEEEKRQELVDTEQRIKVAKIKLDEINKLTTEQHFAAQQSLKDLEWKASIKETDISRNLDRVKDDKFHRINMAAKDYRKKLYEKIQNEIRAQEQDFVKWKEDISNKLYSVENEIDVLRATRDALIEAARREEEKKLQQDYYKIVLSEENFNDIKLLKSIEKFLFNKDPLYKLIWNTFYMMPTKEMLNRIIGKEKSSGIYKITNEINNKVYIGQSVDLHSRLTNHIKAALGIGTIAHQQVHDAMAAEGLENFSFEIVEKCSKEQLNKKEKLWIETYASDKYGYNRTAGGAKED